LEIPWAYILVYFYLHFLSHPCQVVYDQKFTCHIKRARSTLFDRADPTQLKGTTSGSGTHAEILDMSNANQTSSPTSSRLPSSVCAWKMMKAYQTLCRSPTSYTRRTQTVLLSMMRDYHSMCGYQGEETSSTSTKTTLLRSTPHGDCVPEIWIPDSYLGVYVAG
jgi:hypothetical protein